MTDEQRRIWLSARARFFRREHRRVLRQLKALTRRMESA